MPTIKELQELDYNQLCKMKNLFIDLNDWDEVSQIEFYIESNSNIKFQRDYKKMSNIFKFQLKMYLLKNINDMIKNYIELLKNNSIDESTAEAILENLQIETQLYQNYL